MRTVALPLLATALALVSPSVLALPLTAADRTDVEFCGFLANRDSSPKLDDFLVRAAYFDLDGDGIPELLSIADEGTAHCGRFQVANNAGEAISIKRADDVALVDDDWRWTKGQAWFLFGSRAYVLHFQGSGTNYLRYVSRVGSDLTERPLCRFEPYSHPLFVANRPTDRELCREVSEGKVVYDQPAERLPKEKVVADREVPGGDSYLAATTTVDFNNNGQPRTVFLYDMSTGAGPGCSVYYYDTDPSDDRASPAHVSLMALQKLDLDDAYPRRTCLDAVPSWFAYGGLHCLETESTAADSPSSERFEYHTVDVIEGGSAREVCKAIYIHARPRFVGVWSGNGWAPPPSDLVGKSP